MNILHLSYCESWCNERGNADDSINTDFTYSACTPNSGIFGYFSVCFEKTSIYSQWFGSGTWFSFHLPFLFH